MEIEMTRCDQKILVQGVNPNSLQDFWLKLRCTGPDVFAIFEFDGSEAREIQTGWMPQKEETSTQELRECVCNLELLEAFLREHSDTALATIKNELTFHEAQLADTHCYCIYCKSKKGIVGVGWNFRDGDLIKAKMMAVFTLYAFGLSNAEYDPLLWNVAYRHLPFKMNMNLSVADRVFFKYTL